MNNNTKVTPHALKCRITKNEKALNLLNSDLEQLIRYLKYNTNALVELEHEKVMNYELYEQFKEEHLSMSKSLEETRKKIKALQKQIDNDRLELSTLLSAENSDASQLNN